MPQPCEIPKPSVASQLDAGFSPAALWHRWCETQVERGTDCAPVQMALVRPDGTCFRHCLHVPFGIPSLEGPVRHILERTVKFLLWQKGGSTVLVAGPDTLVGHLPKLYGQGGAREFDAQTVGNKIFGQRVTVRTVAADELPNPSASGVSAGGNLDGCRVGFDLGGSDRKSAAVMDGEVVFSEEVPWSPYFESDPEYHFSGIVDSIDRAARHLPRIDAIGGSAAGVYINNEVRVASLFRGVSGEDFDQRVRNIFERVAHHFGDVPLQVVNDGEVTALAGAMSLGEGAVLGVAMGTSEAAGYCDPSGSITPWLNELAFAPIDYRPDAPEDEWSGDTGCGAQYLSQQAVGRLLPAAGIDVAGDMPLPEQLVHAQELADGGDERAIQLFSNIGVYLGYALAHYANFYDVRHVLVLGRVTSGAGGEAILAKTDEVLAADFPGIRERIRVGTPDEKMKRHGQAIAAASLPSTGSQGVIS
jgi:predicted NBD/HSP70 family sugar kinase